MMMDNRARLNWTPGIVAALAVCFFVLIIGLPRDASALPAFARQTGQECAACHNGFPELTPYGRLFKLNAYTFTGGVPGTGEQSKLPPLAVMAAVSFNHTQTGQQGGAAPHYAPNDNPSFDFASVFYGGVIAPHLGAFAQVTYNGIGRSFNWDNLDIRYARSYTLFGAEMVSGISLNNNPTVTDVWNTTPAWRYPFIKSGLAPTPNAATVIEGSLAQEVLGVSAYAFWDRLIYAEVGGYQTLSSRMDSALGVDPNGNSINGVAPYWRLAVQREWGRSNLEVGTFGLAASMYPSRVTGSGTDNYTDIGFDAQYQFLADRDSFSVQASVINERQDLSASYALGNSSNQNNNLHSYNIKASYSYNQTYSGTIGYFQVDGNTDAGLYGSTSANNSPNSAGWIGEIDYMPFNHGGPGFWPWLNAKIGLQYIYYTRFNGGTSNYDGAGRNATDNNTLYLFAWVAF
jgi:hypothetical protein